MFKKDKVIIFWHFNGWSLFLIEIKYLTKYIVNEFKKNKKDKIESKFFILKHILIDISLIFLWKKNKK